MPKYKYLIGTNPNNAQVVYMSWAEVKELAAERSMRRDVYVSREDGDGIKRWMWRRRVLLRHWTE
ncbi:hypothetical protein ACFY05_40515 [Microtetraspora fusca]|uniref:Uncharacterized protein n=1 Tax=Microtetraspora fusca TaxID=1997 RepID=A0ABW6VIC8_MICFU